MVLTNNSVEDLIYFKNKLLTNSAFSVIRPSDGEYLVMTGNEFSNIDNWHYDGKSCLNQDLRDAIQTMTTLDNAFIGLPCKGCGPTLDRWYSETFNIPEEKKTHANVFVNKNWKPFMDLFTENKLPFHYIGPYKSNTHSLNLRHIFPMHEFLVNDWEFKKDEVIREVKRWATYKSGIFIFSAGPISKILIPILAQQNPNNTYLDVGSAFDFYMKGSTNREYANSEGYYSNLICDFKVGHVQLNNEIVKQFTNVFDNDIWNMGQNETRSGLGSTLEYTKNIRDFFPKMLHEYNIKSIIDASCGEWNWMSKIYNTIESDYIGLDVVKAIIDKNNKSFKKDGVSFIHSDGLSYLQRIPDKSVDMVICRQTLEHLTTDYNLNFIKEVKRVSTYFLVSSHEICNKNSEVSHIGGYRTVNLKIEPYADILQDFIIDSKYDGPTKFYCPEMFMLLYRF